MLKAMAIIVALQLIPELVYAQVPTVLTTTSLGNDSSKVEAEAATATVLPVKHLEMFLLQAKASMSKPDMDMALNFWPDYHDADAFGRRDAAALHRPELERTKDLVWAATAFSTLEVAEVGDYDMAKKGFPLKKPMAFGKTMLQFQSYPVKDGSLFLIFDNIDRFSFLPVEEGKARTLVTACRPTYGTQCIYYVKYVFEPTSAGRGRVLEWIPKPMPFVRVKLLSALVYVDPNGRRTFRDTPEQRLERMVFVGRL